MGFYACGTNQLGDMDYMAQIDLMNKWNYHFYHNCLLET
jgi:hypothetical protein